MTWNDLQRARNDLKRTTTGKKRPETTYNNQETTWNDLQCVRNDMKRPTKALKRPTMNKKWPGNDLQRARNDLKQPTTSKTQPIMTWTYLQRAKKRRETTSNKQSFKLSYNMGQTVLFFNTFSTQHLVRIIWTLLGGESWSQQSFKHLCSIMSIFYGI